MGRRQLAGRDEKIRQGQQRDAFFKRMRRKGAVQRLATDGASVPKAATEVTEAVAEAPEQPATAE